ncbi:MAG: acyl-CoA thioesterase, partial [Lutibacter sp.]|nr:acyl-CoA thioesterase [Lutibacter sp.]
MTNNFEETITSQFKVIFPTTLNDHETLFGGEALKWMDEVAYITAIRFTRNKMVTVSTDKIKFLKPIGAGSIVEIVGKVLNVGAVKIDVLVEIYMEEMQVENRQKVISGQFTFAAVNEKGKPILINDTFK